MAAKLPKGGHLPVGQHEGCPIRTWGEAPPPFGSDTVCCCLFAPDPKGESGKSFLDIAFSYTEV